MLIKQTFQIFALDAIDSLASTGADSLLCTCCNQRFLYFGVETWSIFCLSLLQINHQCTKLISICLIGELSCDKLLLKLFLHGQG